VIHGHDNEPKPAAEPAPARGRCGRRADPDPADAARVVRELDGVVFQGRALRVTFARRRGAE
jgi:hypothetical protein